MKSRPVQKTSYSKSVAMCLCLAASAMIYACKTTESEKIEEVTGSTTKDVPSASAGDGAGVFAVSALTASGVTWPLSVAADHGSATLETDGGAVKLSATEPSEAGSGSASCHCRTYQNELYSVFVQFPFGSQEGHAAVTELATEMNGDLPGELRLANGNTIKLAAITISDSRDFLTFLYNGNNETLESSPDVATGGCNCSGFDSYVFSAVVHWPAGEGKGHVEIAEKP